MLQIYVVSLLLLYNGLSLAFPLTSSSSRGQTSFSLEAAVVVAPDEAKEVLVAPDEAKEVVQHAVETKGLGSDSTAFEMLAGQTMSCVLNSDLMRNSMGKGDAKLQASQWINDASAYALKQSIDRIKIKLAHERTGIDRDGAASWMRWMKSIPSPGKKVCVLLVLVLTDSHQAVSD
jgi:hypothetical protein